MKFSQKIAFLLLSGLLLFPTSAYGAVGNNVYDNINDRLDPLEDVYDPSGIGVDDKPLQESILDIVRILFTFLGIIFFLLILYAGWLWMTSAGNDDQISKAKKILAASVIGIAIIFLAYAIADFVINALIDAT